jgi:two-component system sensor kinase FixL
MDLRQTANQAAAVDLRAVLEEFRIVMEPALFDDGISAHWSIEPELPPVWADRQSLMQVFLNLAKNSERAMLGQPKRELRVTARAECGRVVVRFTDTGCGVSEAGRLFRPFQPGAQATGLGLYLSRAFMRSFRGDLRYEAESPGSSFVVDLSPALSSEEKETNEPGDKDSAGGRSQLVPREPQQAIAGRG